MATRRPVIVEAPDGSRFACNRLQYERLHKPRGYKLVIDEDGHQVTTARRRTRKAANPEDTTNGDH